MVKKRSLARRVGDAVRELRLARDLTQAALAEAAGMTSDEVSRIERGAREPRFVTLEKLAEALEVDVGKLFHLAPAASDRSPGRYGQKESTPTPHAGRLRKMESLLEELPEDLAAAAVKGCIGFLRALGGRGAGRERRSRR